jgi:hypothetical protein
MVTLNESRPMSGIWLVRTLALPKTTSSVPKKIPKPKFGLKSSLIDIYEWLFLINRYIFRWPRKYFLSTFLLFWQTLKKCFYLENKEHFEQFAQNTTYRKQKVENTCFMSTHQIALFLSYKCFSPTGLFSEQRKFMFIELN